MAEKERSKQITLFQELKNRIIIPIKPNVSWSFFLYLFGLVIGYGGLGVWFSIVNSGGLENHASIIPPAIGTYFITLWATSFYDLTSKDIANEKSMTILSIIGLGIAVVLLYYSHKINGAPYLAAILGCVLSLVYWYIINVDNDDLHESYDERVRTEAKNNHGKSWDQ